MRRDTKNKLRSRILIERTGKGSMSEFLRQSKFSPKIEFEIEQTANNHLTNYLMKHNLWDAYLKWRKKNLFY